VLPRATKSYQELRNRQATIGPFLGSEILIMPSLKKKNLGRPSEDALALRALSNLDVAAVLTEDCRESRKLNGQLCPNGMKCR
jgi:hypothetical protein